MKKKKLYITFSILLIIIILLTVTKQMQNDTFFTIATGNHIIQDGYDNMDHLTWHGNLEFFKLRWAFDVAIAFIYNVFGYAGIYAFIVITTCAIALSLFYILIKQKNNVIISFLATAIIMLLLTPSGFITGRGQIVSYLLLLWEVYFIEKLINTKQKRYYLALFVISVLIVNFHASVWNMTVILVMPYLAEAIMYRIFKNKGILQKITTESISIKVLIVAIICLILGSFLSPIGTYTYTYMFKIIGEISTSFIAEMQKTDIISTVGMLLGLIIIDVLMLATKTKMKLSDILLFFGLYFMAILARRNQALLYLIGVIPVVRLITNFFAMYDKDNLLEKLNEFCSKTSVLACLTVVIVIGLSSNLVTRIKEKYVNEKTYPVEAVKYIKENLDYKNMKIYNGYNYGSYLELEGIQAFLDSRAEIFTEKFNNVTILKDWYETSKGTVNYNDTFEKYGIDYAIIEDSEIINTYISVDEKYEKVFDDENFSIYVKK